MRSLTLLRNTKTKSSRRSDLFHVRILYVDPWDISAKKFSSMLISGPGTAAGMRDRIKLAFNRFEHLAVSARNLDIVDVLSLEYLNSISPKTTVAKVIEAYGKSHDESEIIRTAKSGFTKYLEGQDSINVISGVEVYWGDGKDGDDLIDVTPMLQLQVIKIKEFDTLEELGR